MTNGPATISATIISTLPTVGADATVADAVGVARRRAAVATTHTIRPTKNATAIGRRPCA